MRKVLSLFAVLLAITALVAVASFTVLSVKGVKASTGTCTATGFMRDGINLTAAVIAAPGSTTSGPISPTGCNIGIYIGPGVNATVSAATIAGYNYYGIVNNGGTAKIAGSHIYQIGESPFNGTQHGVAIYFAYNSQAKGSITNNLIWDYQKGGIVVNGVGSSATVSHNTVIGQGAVNYIAQNGIQIGYGAKATVSNNLVSGNSYTGNGGGVPTDSGGIIVVGGACYQDSLTIGIKIANNTVIDNDIGIWLSNLDIDSNNNCVPTQTPTNIVINKNISTNNYINNTSGGGPNTPYQAGIADQGKNDQITSNTICGAGYTDNPTPPPYLYSIDITATNTPTVTGNHTCSGAPVPPTSSAVSTAKLHYKIVKARPIR